MKWFCRIKISICVTSRPPLPWRTTRLKNCDILSNGQVDTVTKYSSLVHPKSIKGLRKWDIGGEQALRKRATRVTPVNSNASSCLSWMKLVFVEDSAWELLLAWSGVLCELMRAAEDRRAEGPGEVQWDALLIATGPGSWLDISFISGVLSSTSSTLFSPPSSVRSMILFSFSFFTASRSLSEATLVLVGCKEGVNSKIFLKKHEI